MNEQHIYFQRFNVADLPYLQPHVEGALLNQALVNDLLYRQWLDYWFLLSSQNQVCNDKHRLFSAVDRLIIIL